RGAGDHHRLRTARGRAARSGPAGRGTETGRATTSASRGRDSPTGGGGSSGPRTAAASKGRAHDPRGEARSAAETEGRPAAEKAPPGKTGAPGFARSHRRGTERRIQREPGRLARTAARGAPAQQALSE